MNKFYVEGFVAKCAEHKIDPELVVKASGYVPENDMPVVSKAERAQDAKNMTAMQAAQKKAPPPPPEPAIPASIIPKK